ncbi:[protein-PII] uridylyltransferase [Nocardioides sp. AE5]|uniref:[protein-PII] uridylyltransferase n=1 Tax=Nocardioides sp. AE5 TaxID=2962573 RepID=UPI0028825124|nr:[protein-PII] uridylyltransferase [Nocardioides sp. AE5]MDT0202922.1 [protein-PII] uridylyltransferase [Nocardioides sp. AE5]
MTAAERAARTEAADDLCRTAYDGLAGPRTGVALVAVGGYGRGELAPRSDLDVVLLHDDGVDPGALAGQVWYPLWDSGVRLDHAVRSTSEVLAAAAGDLKVALGLLDLRFLAGDPHLALRVRTTVLAQWRRDARTRLPQLRELVAARHLATGELAHAGVPDLKESQGGLRDACVLRALVATWLVDVPHVELERCRQDLLDVRDALHGLGARQGDRIGPEAWAPLAAGLGLDTPLAAQQRVRTAARRISHVSRLAWRRVDGALARPRNVGPRRPELHPVAPGVAIARDEIVLDRGARPADDPTLLLRACAEAAERDLLLAPATAARLVRECGPLPEPWPSQAREVMVRLLAAGRGLLPVWETLEQVGGLDRILPEWEQIRTLPHASTIHRFTVDRHSVETCIEAASLIRQVARPDVLLVAALLHDIGKGQAGDHARVGAPVACATAVRMGFGDDEAGLVAGLVRHHLLLARLATSRDLDDPATVAELRAGVGSEAELDLLLALTEADARATSPKAWTPWRAGLVRHLVATTRASLADAAPVPVPREEAVEIPWQVRHDCAEVSVAVRQHESGATVTVVSGDRVGLLADVAAMLAVQGTSVRAARAWTDDGFGVSQWEVADQFLDAALLRQRLLGIIDGRIDPAARLRTRAGHHPARLEPSVAVRPGASHSATVLEVRAEDRPGVLHRVCAALADLKVSVRSAHVDTLGPQATDVFYLQELGAGALTDDRAAAAAHGVRAALSADGAEGAVGTERFRHG